MVRVRERTTPTERPLLVGEMIFQLFADRGCHVVSVTNPYGRILGFLDRSRYFLSSSSSVVLTRLSVRMWDPRQLTTLWVSTVCYTD
jgi:hypothetical protein